VCVVLLLKGLYILEFSQLLSWSHFCHMKLTHPFHYHGIRYPVYCQVWFCPSPLTTLSYLCFLFMGFVAYPCFQLPNKIYLIGTILFSQNLKNPYLNKE
jgi:hypothetical protein